MFVECQLFIIVLKLQRETEKSDHEYFFFIFNPLLRQYNSSLNFFFLVIKDWSVSAPFSHLAGGMKYQDGKLTVPTTGRYQIYLQIFCKTSGRVYVRANNRVITMIQSPTSSSTMYVGGIFNLKAGDVITFRSAYANFRVFMYSVHTYFGEYLI